MMYIEPTSQYKFVAKPVPSENTLPVASDAPSGAVATSNVVVPVVASTGNPLPPTNTATHFMAPEHVQNKTLNRQVSTNAATGPQGQGLTYDGKRMRKAVQRRTVDYNSSVIRYLESRKWFKSSRNQFAIQPHEIYNIDVVPPGGYIKNPMNAVTTKFVRTSTNKLRCPIFCVVWTPEGRRLVTGASSGEFTLWNGLTFNFETILQAHDRAVRSMVWSHHDVWLLTGDHGGFVKYWQSNMNNVKMYEAHKEPIRGLSFSPSDSKFASCSDDGLVKVWDFYRCVEERQLKGHGADVKCVDWHPSKGLLVSGSKDSQQPIKLWDPKSGNSITTLHAHKSTVMAAKWNSNGNWLLTGSRDHLLKVFDIRVMKEFQTFRGHKKEATAVAWHPIHETLFSSGGSDGSIMFWLTGVDEKAGAMDKAHEGIVWSLAWHPVGHILCSGSNDHTSKFWTRNRPGDTMHDRYNLDINQQDEGEYNEDGGSSSMLPGLAAFDSTAIIPGVGLPVTASNVVLPDSNDTDEDVDLYRDSRRDNFPLSQPTSSNVPPPSSSHPVPSDIRQGILGQFSSGMPPIPGLAGPNSGMPKGPGNEGVRDGFNPLRGMPPGPRRPDIRPPRSGFDRNGDFPNNQAPVRQQRPPFPGSRPQFRPGPRPGVDFFPRGGPGNRDPGMTFRPPGNFPPNQFMRFPGPAAGSHGGPNFTPRAMGDHPRDLGPRPHGFGQPRPELRPSDQPMRDREDAESGEEHRGAGMEPERRRSNDSPKVSPPRLANNRARPERRGSDPSAPGILGDYETHQRELGQRLGNRPQAAGEGQLFRGNSFEGVEQAGPRASGPERRLTGPPSDRPGQGPPPFGRQNSNPRGGQPFQPRFERPDTGRLEDRDRTHDRPGRPGLMGEPALDRPDMAPSEDRPLHDQARSGERGLLGEPPLDRPDMGHPGELGLFGSRSGIPHFGDRPSHERPDRGRPGERPPHERPDMGRPGDRPPHDRPDLGRPGDRPPHERLDLGRPGDRRPHDRPDMGRDKLSHERPDMGRPGDRPPHERPDKSRPDDPKFRNRPEFSLPDDRQMRDRPDDRGPPCDQGRPPNHRPPRPGIGPPFPPPRDLQFHGNERSRADLPPDCSDFDRSPRDRVPPERPESKPMFLEPPDRADGPPNGEQGTIKPLMGVMRPRSGQDPPEAENRGRKRSMEREFDRAPKRMEPSDHRDGVW